MKPTPDHVHCIIKGRLSDALILAKRHKLIYEPVGSANDGREQVGLLRAESVSYNLLLQLMLWFGSAPNQAPYPDGTLLWWGECDPGSGQRHSAAEAS